MRNKWIYVFLFIAIILSGSFFAFKIYNYYKSDRESIHREFTVPSKDPREVEKYGIQTVTQKIDYYINLFRSKNLFKILGREKVVEPIEKEAASAVLTRELSKFELLGIVSAEGESKALIRDTETGKTFYCTGGEIIEDFTVKEVLSDRVIFEKGEDTAELKM